MQVSFTFDSHCDFYLWLALEENLSFVSIPYLLQHTKVKILRRRNQFNQRFLLVESEEIRIKSFQTLLLHVLRKLEKFTPFQIF